MVEKSAAPKADLGSLKSNAGLLPYDTTLLKQATMLSDANTK